MYWRAWRVGSIKTHDSKDIIDPAISDTHNHESKQEWRNRDTDSNHQRPVTHASRAILLEESLCDNGTTHGRGGTDEERGDSTAQSHSSIGVAVRTSDVSNQGTAQRDQEDGPATESVAKWAPGERCTTEDGDEEGDQVASSLHANTQIGRDVDKGGLDGSRSEETDHGVEDDQS